METYSRGGNPKILQTGHPNAVPDPVLILNDGREIVSSNDAAGRMLGPVQAGRDLSLSLRHPEISPPPMPRSRVITPIPLRFP